MGKYVDEGGCGGWVFRDDVITDFCVATLWTIRNAGSEAPARLVVIIERSNRTRKRVGKDDLCP
jgi:hypothetical protein